MKYIKTKYLKNGVAVNRAYTFKTEDDVMAGDMLVTSLGKHVVMVDEAVDMAWVETYGEEKIATVNKVIEPAKVESEV